MEILAEAVKMAFGPKEILKGIDFSLHNTEKFIYDMYEVRCRVDEEKSTGRINIVYLPQHWQ